MNGTPHDPARLLAAEQEALDDELATYALGALPDDEARDVRQHLVICAACRQRAAELAVTVSLVAVACPPVDPSPGVRTRLLGTLDAAPAPAPPDRGRDATPTDVARPPAPLTGRRSAARWLWALPAAALVLFSLGIGLWAIQLERELREARDPAQLLAQVRRAWTLPATAAGGGGRAFLLEPEDASPPVLVAEDLPALAPGRTYQVWVIREGPPQSAAVLPAGAGRRWTVRLSQPVDGARTVAISEEPAGGSPAPTGPIVAAGDL